MKEFLLGFAIWAVIIMVLVSIVQTTGSVQPAFSTPCIHNLAFIYDRGYLTQVIDENGKGVPCK